MEYEGWQNKQTWLVNVWFGDLFETMKDQGIPITVDYMKELVAEYVDTKGPGSFQNDLLINAVAEIDWSSLEDHWGPDHPWEEEYDSMGNRLDGCAFE